MNGKEFQEIAKRMTNLKTGLHWTALGLNFASGRCNVSGADVPCSLRSFGSGSKEALIFYIALAPPPPASTVETVKAFMALVNPLLQKEVQSILDIDHFPEAICFKSMLVREVTPYADRSLYDLIETNLFVGKNLGMSMVALHRGELDLEVAVQNVTSMLRKLH
jgi:hypothetical protein